MSLCDGNGEQMKFYAVYSISDDNEANLAGVYTDKGRALDAARRLDTDWTIREFLADVESAGTTIWSKSDDYSKPVKEYF
jgi:hypothetical protein